MSLTPMRRKRTGLPDPCGSATMTPVGNAQKTVLVVDDNANLAQLLAYVLQHCGYQAVAVHCKADASRSCDRVRPKLALVDLFIGEDSGLETAAEIRQRSPNCKVILMSGSSEAEEVVRRGAVGRTQPELLKKPFSVNDLLQVIHGRPDVLPRTAPHYV